MRNFWVGLIVFVVIILCTWLQLNIFNAIPLFGVKANVGIVLVVALGILTGKTVGVTVGIIYGIFFDILNGKSFGMYTLLFFVVGYFCGKINRGFSKENKSSIIMITAITTIIFETICYLMLCIIYRYNFVFLDMVWKIILETIYNVIISSILFKAFVFLSEIINKGKRSYYLL